VDRAAGARGPANRLVGRSYGEPPFWPRHPDDAYRCIAEATRQNADHFHALSGESPESVYLAISWWSEIRRGVPWILTVAIAGLMAGCIVHAYEAALDALVILALYMPMLADTGGNVGSKNASLVIRAIATGEVGIKNGLRALSKAAGVAIVPALVCSLSLF
jgi:magnesium transporter